MLKHCKIIVLGRKLHKLRKLVSDPNLLYLANKICLRSLLTGIFVVIYNKQLMIFILP